MDIPDDRGVYWKWLIFYSETANQFPKFGVIKCNYYFQWNEGFDENGKPTVRKMWGVERTQSSYTSGVWTGHNMTVFDEQDKFWLPFNSITSEIAHDMRFIISMPRKKPYVYIISKVQDTIPKGIITFTLKQVEFNQFTDYVNLDTQEMIADYYISKNKPNKDGTDDVVIDKDNDDNKNNEDHEGNDNDALMFLDAEDNYELLIGDTRTIELKNKKTDFEVIWKLFIDGQVTDESHSAIDSIEMDNNSITISLARRRQSNGVVLTICATNAENPSETASIDLNVTV